MGVNFEFLSNEGSDFVSATSRRCDLQYGAVFQLQLGRRGRSLVASGQVRTNERTTAE